MSQIKVVELKVEGRKPARLSPLIHTIRQQSKSAIRDLLEGLFNGTDDALFELADRSQSNTHQEMYFDAMRMVRLHRKSIIESFFDKFSRGFEGLAQPADHRVEHDPDPCGDSDEPNYSLIDQDELEMSVAVSGIVSKVTSHYSLTIMQLTKRLNELVEGLEISERTNPLGPAALSEAFADCLDSLDVHIRVRIILMKLFERFVMERIGPLYEAVNQSLIKAGVLPDLKRSVRNPSRADNRLNTPINDRHGQTAQPMAPKASPGQDLRGSDPDAGISFEKVQTLLAGVRGSDASSSTQPTLESREVVYALSDIQRAATGIPIDVDQVPDLGDVRTLVLNQASGSGQKSLGRPDEDTVNFVGMLFDYILNDRNLAIPMKALIGRLQIPIVKLAIMDKSFFSKSAHPARTLLNELSSAGIGWSSAKELKRDALYDKIESVVARVLNDFSDDPQVFVELLHDLRAFVEKDAKRSVLVEQRVKESETGKARTQSAKATVQALINQKACGLRLPVVAGRFISETWSRVLTLRCIKNDQHSQAWTSGVDTLDDLLWVLQPLSDLDAINRRDAIVAQLLADVQSGMREIGSPEEDINAFSRWLNGHLQELSSNDRMYLEEDESHEVEVPMDVVEEIVLTAEVHSDDHFDDCEPEFVAPLKHLTEGTWVEIKQASAEPMRCKLATITQPGHNYVFVNRRGMKVYETRRMGIAQLIDQNQLSVIDESQVFDRALQSVIGNLRELQRKRR